MVDIFYEDLKPLSFSSEFYEKWLTDVCVSEGKVLGDLSIIFSSDSYLLQINQDYLKHDYYTDIITFDYCEDDITGDLFISLDRVSENAIEHKVTVENERNRVVVHGLLHLIGYGDKSPEESKLMRQLEEKYLSIVPRETID